MLYYCLLLFCQYVLSQAIKYELCERLNLAENNSTCQFIIPNSPGNNTQGGDGNYKPKSQCENCSKCKHSNYLCEFGCESLKSGVDINLVKTYIQNLMGDDKCVDKARSKCESCTKGNCNACINTSLEFYNRCQKWGTAFDKTTGTEMGECFQKCNSTVKSYNDYFTCTFNCYLPGFKQINKDLNNLTDIKLNTDSNYIKFNLNQYWQFKNICYDQTQLSIDDNTQFKADGSKGTVYRPNNFILYSIILMLFVIYV